MKIEELFPGAVFQIEGQIRTANIVSKYGSVLYDVGIIERNDSIADCSGVPITPEILMRLEGENFSISDTHGQKDSFLIVAGDFDVYIKWVGDDIYYGSHYPPQIKYLHELQTRVRLDSGIVLNLKPE